MPVRPEIVKNASDAPFPEDPLGLIDEVGYWHHLLARPVSQTFLAACAQAIMATLGGMSVTEGTSAVTAMFMELENGLLRVALKNKMPWYAKPKVDLGRTIKGITVKTDFPLVTVQPEGSAFSVRVPGTGLVVLDVEFA